LTIEAAGREIALAFNSLAVIVAVSDSELNVIVKTSNDLLLDIDHTAISELFTLELVVLDAGDTGVDGGLELSVGFGVSGFTGSLSVSTEDSTSAGVLLAGDLNGVGPGLIEDSEDDFLLGIVGGFNGDVNLVVNTSDDLFLDGVDLLD